MHQMSSPTSSSTPVERIEKAAVSRWKLETLTGLLGLRSLQSHQQQSELNQRAENEHVRRSVWGFEEKAAQGDDMQSQTILGDHHITHPTPIILNNQPSGQTGSLAKTLAILAAGALIPGAGVGGYLASQLLKPKPETKAPADETLDLGLLRVEDLEQ
jgi:hypothetical protein